MDGQTMVNSIVPLPRFVRRGSGTKTSTVNSLLKAITVESIGAENLLIKLSSLWHINWTPASYKSGSHPDLYFQGTSILMQWHQAKINDRCF